jgi:diadenosine tetraphosphate (Ap4A) HIT family hydrolase
VACTFCANPVAVGKIVFEDERCWVLLHHDWSPRGHAMIVARRHIENASDLDEEEWLHLARVWHRAERVLLDETGAERAIIFKLGILTPHLHVHIYPVSSQATREDVFEAFDGKKREAKDDAFVERVRAALS